MRKFFGNFHVAKYFRQFQAYAIYSLFKLVQVNYFRVKNFRHFAQNENFFNNESFCELQYVC